MMLLPVWRLREHYHQLLRVIAGDIVPLRPDREYPRAVKIKMSGYPPGRVAKPAAGTTIAAPMPRGKSAPDWAQRAPLYEPVRTSGDGHLDAPSEGMRPPGSAEPTPLGTGAGAKCLSTRHWR